MTLGSCALCLDGRKSQLYGGPRRGWWDLRAPSFLFPPQITGIFSGGDDSGAGEEGAAFSLSVMESWQHGAMCSILDDDDKAGVGTWSNYR